MTYAFAELRPSLRVRSRPESPRWSLVVAEAATGNPAVQRKQIKFRPCDCLHKPKRLHRLGADFFARKRLPPSGLQRETEVRVG